MEFRALKRNLYAFRINLGIRHLNFYGLYILANINLVFFPSPYPPLRVSRFQYLKNYNKLYRNQVSSFTK